MNAIQVLICNIHIPNLMRRITNKPVFHTCIAPQNPLQDLPPSNPRDTSIQNIKRLTMSKRMTPLPGRRRIRKKRVILFSLVDFLSVYHNNIENENETGAYIRIRNIPRPSKNIEHRLRDTPRNSFTLIRG